MMTLMIKLIVFCAFCVYGTHSGYTLTTIQAATGSSLSLTCNYTGYSLANVSWSKHQIGQLSTAIYVMTILLSASHTIDVSTPNLAVLTIKSVASSDYGVFYRCLDATTTTDLYLAQVASVSTTACDTAGLKASPVYSATLGSPVTLQCTFGSLAVAALVWAKHQPPMQGVVIYNTGTLLNPLEYSINNNSTVSSLTITSVKDSGFYTCIYYNPLANPLPTDLGMYSVCSTPKSFATIGMSLSTWFQVSSLVLTLVMKKL